VFGALGLVILILLLIYRKAIVRFLSKNREISGSGGWDQILEKTSSSKTDKEN